MSASKISSFFDPTDAIEGFWVLVGIWVAINLLMLLFDAVIASNEDETMMLRDYLTQSQYKVYDIFLMLSALPAILLFVTGVLFKKLLVWFAKSIRPLGRGIIRIMNITIFSRSESK